MKATLTKLLWLLPMLVSAVVLLRCSNTNSNDHPISHWLNDGEDCTRASAAAIIKSGLPYPNFGTEEVASTVSGEKPKRRIKTVDMWLGDVRFVIPAEVSGISGGYEEHHPRRHQALHGSLPNFYPPGTPGPEIDGMGSMVDVRFKCTMDAKYAATWGKGWRSNAEGIAAVKAQYEESLRNNPKYPGTVTVNIREDIGMMEVLLDRKEEAYGQRFWEATYWPLNGELRGPDGSVSSIGCQTRHDPIEHRYGKRGWRCTAGMSVTPNAPAEIDIYVSQIQHMPAIFEQVKQLLMNAKQSSGK